MTRTARRSDQTATYKGKSYRLLFLGDTKYGRRAKLAFFDGSREFWVDASKVQVRESSPNRSRGPYGTYECEECGDYVRPGTRCWETGLTH